jgi:hypothetical protein
MKWNTKDIYGCHIRSGGNVPKQRTRGRIGRLAMNPALPLGSGEYSSFIIASILFCAYVSTDTDFAGHSVTHIAQRV